MAGPKVSISSGLPFSFINLTIKLGIPLKTKMLYFLVLWGLLVLVQISAVLIVDFTSPIETFIITGIGTMLTLYLGLKVERKRVAREEERTRRQEAITDKEVRDPENYFVMNGFSEPESFFEWYADDPEPRERLSAQALSVSNVIQFPARGTLLEENWKEVADNDETEISPVPDPDICKHCYRQIDGCVHAEGMNRGKVRCSPEDTLGGYGYNAEPTGADCSQTCLGYK